MASRRRTTEQSGSVGQVQSCLPVILTIVLLLTMLEDIGANCASGKYGMSRMLLHSRPLSLPLSVQKSLSNHHTNPKHIHAESEEKCEAHANKWEVNPEDIRALPDIPWYILPTLITDNSRETSAAACERIRRKAFLSKLNQTIAQPLTKVPPVDVSSLKLEWELPPARAPTPKIPLYWITLREASGSEPSQRTRSMINQLKRLGWYEGITSYRVDAVDGRGSPRSLNAPATSSSGYDSLHDFVSANSRPFVDSVPCYLRPCLPTEIATLISHVHAVRKAWHAGHSMALVAEDDVDLSLYDESALKSTILSDSLLDGGWSSVQLYTGNPEVLSNLFMKDPGVVELILQDTSKWNTVMGKLNSSQRALGAAWGHALSLYSRRGMKELLQKFGFSGGVRLFQGLTGNLGNNYLRNSNRPIDANFDFQYQADFLMKNLVSKPFISTRPLANVFLDNSTIDDDDVKAARADVVIGLHSDLLLGAAQRKKYFRNEIEMARTANHFRAIASAYHAGHSGIVVSEEDFNLGEIDMKAFAQAMREAQRILHSSARYGKKRSFAGGMIVKLVNCGSYGSELVQNRSKISGTMGKHLLPILDDQMTGGGSFYAIVGRDALGKIAKLWNNQLETLQVPANESLIVDSFLFDRVQRQYATMCAPKVVPANHTQTEGWSGILGMDVSRRLGSCTNCPAGWMTSVSGQPSCKMCPKGYFISASGRNRCEACQQGRYNNLAGRTSCNSCQRGKFVESERQTVCKACEQGRYQDATAGVGCKACEQGRYNNFTGVGACSECPHGMYQDETEGVGCKSCSVGLQASLKKSTCVKCKPGYYRGAPLSQPSCNRCPVGYFVPHEKADSCSRCSAGKFSDNEGSTACKDCPKGRYLNQIMIDGHILECMLCASAENPGAYSCDGCAAGKYGSMKHEEGCKFCTEGRYSTGGNTCGDGNINCGNHSQKKGCEPCPSGWYGTPNETDRFLCNACPPGRYSEESAANNAGTCQACPAGYYSNVFGLDQLGFCFECGAGKWSDVSGADHKSFCKPCEPGYYSSAQNNRSLPCIACTAGKFFKGGADESFLSPPCEPCPTGYFAGVSGASACAPCEAGQAASMVGSKSCESCSPGTHTFEKGATTCGSCPSGYFQSDFNGTTCFPCIPGKYATEQDTTMCYHCQKGYYQDRPHQEECKKCAPGSIPSSGNLVCIACAPGMYADEEGLSKCKSCPQGYLQGATNMSFCELKNKDQIVLSGTMAIEVPHGSRIICSDADSDCRFIMCESGTYGDIPASEYCHACEPGKSSHDGSTSCFDCQKGKYAASSGQAFCLDCPQGWFQPQESHPSVQCTKCPEGYRQHLEGESSCRSLGWITDGSKCSSTQFLNDSSTNKTLWMCEACVPGAECSGDSRWSDLRPKFGWWKVPLDESIKVRIFVRCMYPPACLGAANLDLKDLYFRDGVDLALEGSQVPNSSTVHPNSTESNCAYQLGFKNVSKLCQDCRHGFAHTFDGSECLTCEDPMVMMFVVVASSSLMILCFVALISLRIRSFRIFNPSRRRTSTHSVLKRILLSHLQMVYLILSLSVPWPQFLSVGLRVILSSTSITSSAHSMECVFQSLNTHSTHAGFMYTMAIFFGLSPFFFGMLLYIFWFFLAPASPKKCTCGVVLRKGGKIFGVPTATVKEERNFLRSISGNSAKELRLSVKEGNTTQPQNFYPSSADMFLASLVLLWYVSLPTLLRLCTKMLDCTFIANDNSDSWMILDLSEPCWRERHALHTIFVTIPMILLYGIIVPLIIFYYLRKAGKERLDNASIMLRFGLFYSGFTDDRFWWEFVVLTRKYLIILVSTLVEEHILQIQFSLCILIAALHLHDVFRPYGNYGDGDLASRLGNSRSAMEKSNQLRGQHRERKHESVQEKRNLLHNTFMLHKFDYYSMLSLIALSWCGVFFFQGKCNAPQNAGMMSMCITLSALLLIANIFYIFSIITKFFREWSKRNSWIFDRLRSVKENQSRRFLPGIFGKVRASMNLNAVDSKSTELAEMVPAREKINPLVLTPVGQ